MKNVQVNPFLLQCYFTVRRMQSNFCRYHFGLEWEKRKIVRRVHAKRILQTAPHTNGLMIFLDTFLLLFLVPCHTVLGCLLLILIYYCDA